MVWPPPTQKTNIAGSDPTPNKHASLHNDLGSAVNDLIAEITLLKANASTFQPGDVVTTVNDQLPTGWLWVDGTITNGKTLHPALWAAIPAAWQSGNDIDFPDVTEAALRIGDATKVGQVDGSNADRAVPLLAHHHSNTHQHSAGKTGHADKAHHHTGNTGNVSATHHHGSGTVYVIPTRKLGAGGGHSVVTQTHTGTHGSYRLPNTGNASANHHHAFTTGGDVGAHGHAFTAPKHTGNTGEMGTAAVKLNVLGKGLHVRARIKA